MKYGLEDLESDILMCCETITVPLNQMDVRDYGSTVQYAMSPEQGLNIIGLYTDKNKKGITFIVLESVADGRKFRPVLNEALRKMARSMNVGV
jgi:hypothetical protein